MRPVASAKVVTDEAGVSRCYGYVTFFTDADAKRETIRQRNPLGTVLEPAEIAEMFVWLASPAARGVTGQVIRADGGLVVR